MAQSPASAEAASSSTSLSNSMHRQAGDISVDTLISYLVAAKRSLASIHSVHRATTILADARSTIESTTTLIARTTYLRRCLASQLKILRGIQFELESATQVVQAEFQAALKGLDATDKKLALTITTLKETKIEQGFRSPFPGEEDGQDDSNVKKTLHDFVDDQPVDDLRENIKDAIDRVQDAKKEMDRSICTLEDDLQSINDSLSDKPSSSNSSVSDLQPPNIPRLAKLLENHAREMAESLESLVKHYDLCVVAIKHTEGGGAAVAQNLDAKDVPDGIGVETFEGPAEPISEEERFEMMQVLENDASEVDDVVIEIQDRSAKMEAFLEQIDEWSEQTVYSHGNVTSAFRVMESIETRLSTHLAESSRYAACWAEEKAKIEDGIAGMEDLREVYDNFLNAYDSLIVETARRRSVKKQMERIVQEAHARLEQLYDEDLAEREAFRGERGDFLPSNIWHGLNSLPPRFTFSRMDHEEPGSVPELPKKVVEEALRRLKAGTGQP